MRLRATASACGPAFQKEPISLSPVTVASDQWPVVSAGETHR